MSEYIMIPQFPTVADYCRLRVAAGLSPKTLEAATAGLGGTWFGVSIIHRNEVVGMARIVGDGGCFFQFVDGAIASAHQGRGLGDPHHAIERAWWPPGTVQGLRDHDQSDRPRSGMLAARDSRTGWTQRWQKRVLMVSPGVST